MSHPTQAAWRETREGASLELVRRLRQPIDKVWAALTTPERLTAWMGVEWLGEAGPLRIGAPFDYRFANTDLESRGRVLVLDPPRVLEHSWFENIPPAAVVRWALEPDGGGCVLTLTHRAGPPEDGPRTAAGWTQLLESLAASLSEPDAEVGGGMQAWRRRRDEYAAAFPPKALRDGRRIEADGHPALRFERRLAKPAAAVWSALVEPEALKRWLQAEATIDPEPGGRFHLILGGWSSRMEGRILRWRRSACSNILGPKARPAPTRWSASRCSTTAAEAALSLRTSSPEAATSPTSRQAGTGIWTPSKARWMARRASSTGRAGQR